MHHALTAEACDSTPALLRLLLSCSYSFSLRPVDELFRNIVFFLGMLNVSLQLTFSVMQRLGVSFLYVYYVKTVYIYISWNNGWAVAHKDMFNASDISEYLVLYCIKTMFCLCHVLHSTFLKTWYICLNPTLNYKSLRVYSKQKAAGVSSRGKLNIPLSESFITSEQLRWEVCLSFDITCWTLLPQQTALNCNFFSSESDPAAQVEMCVFLSVEFVLRQFLLLLIPKRSP